MPSQQPTSPAHDEQPSPHAVESMLYLAYNVSKQFSPLAAATDGEIDLSMFDAAQAFVAMNRKLDDLEADGERFAALCLSTEFMSARVYANAMCYTNELLKRARLPALRGEEQLRDARATRDALRERLGKLDREDGRSPLIPVPKRSNAARDVAAELTDLAKYGHDVRLRAGADSASLYGALFVARLTSEQLLTAVGDIDAPPLILQLRREQREACKLAVAHWRAVRAQVQPLCADEAELERLAPWM